jgi:hypothetical protein
MEAKSDLLLWALRTGRAYALRSNPVCTLRIGRACALRTVESMPCVQTLYVSCV